MTAQGVQAIWVGGDNTVALALDSVVSAARKARIPVFSALPIEPNRGTLFDIGTNFNDAGGFYGDAGGTFGDNELRFATLSRGALEIAARAWGVPDGRDHGPDVIHAHDWHAALAPRPNPDPNVTEPNPCADPPSSTPRCEDYCRLNVGICTGNVTQYESDAQCLWVLRD